MKPSEQPHLEPCPFCGGEAKMQFGWPSQQGGRQRMVFVMCKTCRCKTQTVYQLRYMAWEDCKRYAVELWNRRTA